MSNQDEQGASHSSVTCILLQNVSVVQQHLGILVKGSDALVLQG